jgi:hypothetical protein
MEEKPWMKTYCEEEEAKYGCHKKIFMPPLIWYVMVACFFLLVFLLGFDELDYCAWRIKEFLGF